ncbi:LPS-assembly protein LptD [Nitratifractor sp.]
MKPARQIVTALLFAVATLTASAPSGDPSDPPQLAHLYADRFESRGDIVYARGHVALSYDGSLFLAKTARFDRKRNVIVLTGNVEIFGSKGHRIVADRMVFEVDHNRVRFRDFFQADRQDIWVYADEAQKQDGNYTLHNSVLSSCHVDDPDWSVRFKDATYDSETKYMKLHGVRFYAGSLPVFYTPYLGFSLARERSTGLLMPHLGYGKDEGFIYDQPWFWAIAPDKDLQLDPQIRKDRGAGLYATYRFVDSDHSFGWARIGYFADQSSFARKFSLKNRHHYGLEAHYENGDPLRKWEPLGYRSGLYLDLDLFNDIDYLNLQFEKEPHLEETSRFKESRLNLFLYDDTQYFGLRGRYFIDTTRVKNDQTIQELPSLRYHLFSTPLWDDHLSVTADLRYANYYRKTGLRAYRGAFDLPIRFQTSFFDDVLNLALEERFDAADTHFYHGAGGRFFGSENHYAAATLRHSLELSTDLVRRYDSGVHTMLLKATYTKTNLLAEGNLKFSAIDPHIASDYVLDMVYDTRLTFSMHHFWKSDSGKWDVDYLARADYYPEHDSRWNSLRQELDLRYDSIHWKSRVDYSIQDHHFLQVSNSLSYDTNRIHLALEQNRRYRSDDYSLVVNDLGFVGHYKFNDTYTAYGAYTYDFRHNGTKDWELGLGVDRKCWNFTLLFKQDITPILTDSGKGSIRNNTVYFRFNLVPFGGVGSLGGAKL